MAEQPPDNDRTIRPFAAVLQEIGGGKVAARLAEQLAELTEAVSATGKKGTLALTITVAPIGKGNTANLVVSARIACKTPEGDDAVPSSVFFHDVDGNLTRHDPNQPTLPLRGLDTPKAV